MVNPGQTPQQNSDGILSGATVWDGYKLNASSPLIDAGIYVPQMGTLISMALSCIGVMLLTSVFTSTSRANIMIPLICIRQNCNL